MEFKKMFGNRIYLLSAITLMGLLAYLSTIPGVSISCTDEVCDINEECTAYCNVTNKGSRSVYLYNYGDWTMDFSPEVKNFDLYIKYYGKWRYTNFTMETRLGNIPNKAKYVFVFPRYSTKQFKIVVDLKDTNKVKYQFGTLDPVLVGYRYLYKNCTTSKSKEDYKKCMTTCTAKELILKNVTKTRKVAIYRNVTEEKCCTAINASCHTCKELITCKEPQCYDYTYQVVDHYIEEKYTVEEKIGYKCRDGVIVDGKEYDGSVNIKDDMLFEWSVPIADRNFVEFGTCREYEKAKGVCKEKKLI